MSKGEEPQEDVKLEGVFDDGKVEHTITLEELIFKLNEAANSVSTKKANRLLFLNTAAALRTLGEKVEELDRELTELKNAPRIIKPGGGLH